MNAQLGGAINPYLKRYIFIRIQNQLSCLRDKRITSFHSQDPSEGQGRGGSRWMDSRSSARSRSGHQILQRLILVIIVHEQYLFNSVPLKAHFPKPGHQLQKLKSLWERMLHKYKNAKLKRKWKCHHLHTTSFRFKYVWFFNSMEHIRTCNAQCPEWALGSKKTGDI